MARNHVAAERGKKKQSTKAASPKIKRSSSAKVSVTNSGVRVYEPKAGGYWRITWKEKGKQHDTTAKSAESAYAKAAQIEKRIARANGHKESQPVSEMAAAYLDSSKRTVHGDDWGLKHEKSQKSLFSKHIIPQIGEITCDDLTFEDLQKIIKGAPSNSVADHLQSAIKAWINWAHLDGWITTSPKKLTSGMAREKKRRRAQGSPAGETDLYIDKRNIPTHKNVDDLAKAAAVTGGEWWFELLFNLDAYSGLRIGELLDLDINAIDIEAREIRVQTQALQIGGKVIRTLPKWGTTRTTVFPVETPSGYPLQSKLRKRIKELKKLKEVPTLADGSKRILLFPNSKGSWYNQSNFSNRVRRPAQELAGWPKSSNGKQHWTFHSLRHVFCTYYLFDLGKDLRDVSIAAGHRDYSTTMEMYIGQSEGAIKRLNE